MFLKPTKTFTRPNFNTQMIKKFLPIALVLVLASCDKKFNEIGADVLPSNPIQGSKALYPVKVSHTLINDVQTNAGSLLQLGQRQDKLFGTTSAAIVSQFNLSSYAPFFGAFTHQREIDSTFNEMETVTDVWLEIPFYTNQNDADGDGLIDLYDIDDSDINSDSDGDGVSDINERNNGTDPTNPDTDGDGTPDGEDTETVNPNPDKKWYAIDSLFGNREATFHVEITKLNYFLRQLDPAQNFEQFQPYYSDFDIASHKEQPLGSGSVQLDFNEIVVEGENAQNLTPRLRVPLDKTIFQQLIIDKEGATELSTAELWQNYFKSISIETRDFSAPLLMLLNFNGMVIRVAYTYKSEDTEADPVEIVDKDSEFLINAGGLKFNTVTKTSVAAPELNNIVSAVAPAQIALSGGLGSVATITLFEDNEVLEAIKGQHWLLNEANLTMYVDKQAVEQYSLSLPERLYLYNANTNAPIIDYLEDGTSTSTLSKLVYGGFLLEEDEKQYYKIRLTSHLRNIIKNDSINAPLRLSLINTLSNQGNVPMAKVENSTLAKIPSGTVSSPKSAVLIGPSPTDPVLADLKLQLEVFYTEIN